MASASKYPDKDPFENVVSLYFLIGILCVMAVALFGCSPKTMTEVIYRDRIVRDTARVEIPKVVEKIVTRDTVSHLENDYAISDAVVSDGFLWHSLETKPQIIEAPVEVHVTDTLIIENAVEREKIVKVEKPLSWWQKTRMEAFWWLILTIIVCLGWIFRRPLSNLIKILLTRV